MLRWTLAILILTASSIVAAGSEYRVRVELADKDGAPRAIVTTKLACAVPAKCPEWALDLGRADSVELLAVVDLFGEPKHVRNAPEPATPTATLPESTKLPAAFVRTLQTDAEGSHWDRWSLVSLQDGHAKVIWRGELALTKASGGGFSTVDGVDLVATKSGEPLALAYTQTALAKANAPARSTGAKVTRRFVLKDGTYQRE